MNCFGAQSITDCVLLAYWKSLKHHLKGFVPSIESHETNQNERKRWKETKHNVIIIELNP